jgi:hypothetical protein
MNTRKPSLIINLQIIVSIIVLFNIISSSKYSYAQEKTDTTSKKHNSFCFKYDIGQWICQYPNLELEYKFSNRFAVNLSGTYLRSGVVWPLMFLTTGKILMDRNLPSGENKYILEHRPLKGLMIKSGLKFYLKSRYFITSIFYFRYQNYNMYGWREPQSFKVIYETLYIKDFGLGLIFGNENKRRKNTFGEWYVGAGLYYSIQDKILGHYDNHDYIQIKLKDFKFLPSVFFGYNIGLKTGKNKYPAIESQCFNALPKNSFYYEILGNGFFGSLNYERVLLNKKIFYFTGRIGLGYFPFPADGSSHLFPLLLLNDQFQFSNRCSFETGYGIRWELPGILRDEYIPALVSQFCFRYNGPKGFLFRVGFTPILLSPLYEEQGWDLDRIQPGLSFGYSFGKRK